MKKKIEKKLTKKAKDQNYAFCDLPRNQADHQVGFIRADHEDVIPKGYYLHGKK